MSLFSKVELCKTDKLLDKSRAAREERATERQREVAAITTQVYSMHVMPSILV